jgi:hypothetical protein
MQLFRSGPGFRHLIKVLAASAALLAGELFGQDEIASATSGKARMSEQEADTAIENLKELANEAEQWLQAFPSSHLELDPVLEECEYDLENIFQWVKTETRWVPYRGMLRGANGVLMDRRGNSLDRSLLLAKLLSHAGFETRLARLSLDPETVATLLESGSNANDTSQSVPIAALNTEDVRIRQKEVTAHARDLANLVGFTSAPSNPHQTEQFLADLSDHWWVQVKNNHDWRDLDPMTPDGGAFASAQSPSILSVDKIPDDLQHRLELSLVIERWEEGKLIEERPLNHRFAVADAPAPSYLEINFMPYSEAWAGRDDDDEEFDVLDIADSANFWRPLLKINGEMITGDWFKDSGQFEAPVFLATAKKLSAARGALSSLGGKAPKKDPETYLTAAWLEFVTTDPANRGERVRRELFDLLAKHRASGKTPGQWKPSTTEKRDRGLALLNHTSSLVLNSTPHPEALEQFAFETWSRNKNVFIALVYLAAGREDERVPIALSQADFRPLDLIAMATLRELWSRHGDFTYLDRINVISSHLINTTEKGSPATQFATDIVINRIGVSPGAPVQPHLVRLEQGVLDTLVETRFSKNEEVFNTFHLFGARSKNSAEWIAVAPEMPVGESLRELPKGEISRINAAVQSGAAVVAAPAPYALGGHPFASWWQIDLSDGTTLGRGYRGWGSELGESLPVRSVATRETAPVARLTGRKIVCKTLNAAVEITVVATVDFAANWAANQVAARAAGRGALIDKIKAANPGTYDDLPDWCK